MSRERVMVVESVPQSQRWLQAQLLARGFVVRVEDRGETALTLAAEFERVSCQGSAGSRRRRKNSA
jgi:CheY-like chemotaxis protein